MLAGSRPGGRLTFLASPRKVSKRRRPHCPCPFGCAYGQPVVLARRAGRRTRCALARSAQTAAASQSTKLVCPAAHQHALRAALLGTGRGAKRGYRNAAALPTPQQKYKPNQPPTLTQQAQAATLFESNAAQRLMQL